MLAFVPGPARTPPQGLASGLRPQDQKPAQKTGGSATTSKSALESNREQQPTLDQGDCHRLGPDADRCRGASSGPAPGGRSPQDRKEPAPFPPIAHIPQGLGYS